MRLEEWMDGWMNAPLYTNQAGWYDGRRLVVGRWLVGWGNRVGCNNPIVVVTLIGLE